MQLPISFDGGDLLASLKQAIDGRRGLRQSVPPPWSRGRPLAPPAHHAEEDDQGNPAQPVPDHGLDSAGIGTAAWGPTTVVQGRTRQPVTNPCRT